MSRHVLRSDEARPEYTNRRSRTVAMLAVRTRHGEGQAVAGLHRRCTRQHALTSRTEPPSFLTRGVGEPPPSPMAETATSFPSELDAEFRASAQVRACQLLGLPFRDVGGHDPAVPLLGSVRRSGRLKPALVIRPSRWRSSLHRASSAPVGLAAWAPASRRYGSPPPCWPWPGPTPSSRKATSSGFPAWPRVFLGGPTSWSTGATTSDDAICPLSGVALIMWAVDLDRFTGHA